MLILYLHDMKIPHQFTLLTQKRFLPFFTTQFLGAFNDNIFRNALIILIAFSGLPNKDILVNISTVLFILPFLLFSPLAGQLADKFSKTTLIRLIKLAEIIISLLFAIGIYYHQFSFLIGMLFLMGTQSAFFGPLKYSYLPQTLHTDELVGGNGLVESGTFAAILLGTIVGGTLVSLPDNHLIWLCISVIFIACLGYFFSCFIVKLPPSSPDLKINWRPIQMAFQLFKQTKTRPSVFLTIMGISWFWGYGIAMLTQLPNYVELFLYGNQQVATVLLVTFSVGIGLGALLCEKLSGGRIELGLVPLGALGITLFTFDLAFAHKAILSPAVIYDAKHFLSAPHTWRVILDLGLIGLFAGFYTVPLYAFLQHRARAHNRSQSIAFCNIMNTLFMIGTNLYTIVLFYFDFSIPTLFLTLAILNAAITLYIFKLLPIFFLRFFSWILIHFFYRLRIEGLENIPKTGPALIICNHVSYLDPVIINAVSKRPIRFVMDHGYYTLFGFHYLFAASEAIPISAQIAKKHITAQAFDKVDTVLKRGGLLGIFPEGAMTRDGELKNFKNGINKILKREPVPVIPMAISGLWGSLFSHHSGKPLRKLPRKIPFFSRITLKIGKPIVQTDKSLTEFREAVEKLLT